MKTLRPESLTAEAFAPFGEVISTHTAQHHFSINAGNTERYHNLARLVAGEDGTLIASIFRGQPRALPFVIEMMERHPHGSQAFVPMQEEPYLVVVAPPGPPPEANDLVAFLAKPGEGVNYAPGMWHHPLLALNRACEFLVIDRSGPGNNCEEVRIEPPATVYL